MPYSTADDPRMGQARTLARSQEELTAEKERLRNFTSGDAARERLKRIRTVTGRLKSQNAELRRMKEWEQEIAASISNRKLKQSLRAADRQHKRTRGQIAPRRGLYDEDVTQTARADRLDLDPGAVSRNPGAVYDPKTGTIIRLGNTDTTRRDFTVDEVKRGVSDEGPKLPGCSWVEHGDGAWPSAGGKHDGDGGAYERHQGPGPVDEWTSWRDARRQSHDF